MRRLAAAGAAALVLAGALLALRATPARAATPATGAGITLLGQSPWLKGQGMYEFHLGLHGAGPDDRLDMRIYRQTTTRTGFQQDAAGPINDYYFYWTTPTIASLQPDASGGVSLQLPINAAQPTGDPLSPIGNLGTGVYPVQFSLVDQNGSTIGTPLVTFITFVQQTESTSITPISAAVIIPYTTTPTLGPDATVGAPSPSEVNRLSQLADILAANSSVPVTLDASPLTLDQLRASSSAAARRALADLSIAGASGKYQIAPSTYAPVSMSDLISAQLNGEVDQQLKAGSATLAATFGEAPGDRTWVVEGPLDSSTLSAMVGRGAQQVITPDSDLTPLANPVQITFAGSTTLTDSGNSVQSVGADAGLTEDFTRSDSPVLAANQLLADLAMIYTEAPNAISKRGLAILPPASWTVDPVFVKTLLAGLRNDPLVSATTASSLFNSIGAPQSSRSLAHPKSPPPEAFLVVSASTIQQYRSNITDLANVYTDDKVLAASLLNRLLLAESPQLSDDDRQSILNLIEQATVRVLKAATLPPGTSITLTAAKSQLPITILTQGGARPTVELVMQSPHLVFRAYSPPGGTCSVMNESTETCTLTLTSQNTTLKVPVEARSSGVFPLDVYLYPPRTAANSATALQLAYAKDTVRSTAVSGVAVVLIGVAGAALILWWGRDLRRGRRPKGMVPAPGSDANPIRLGDPDLDSFFNDPPPEPRPESMSPTRVSGGPTPTTDSHGRDRETRE